MQGRCAHVGPGREPDSDVHAVLCIQELEGVELGKARPSPVITLARPWQIREQPVSRARCTSGPRSLSLSLALHCSETRLVFGFNDV